MDMTLDLDYQRKMHKEKIYPAMIAVNTNQRDERMTMHNPSFSGFFAPHPR